MQFTSVSPNPTGLKSPVAKAAFRLDDRSDYAHRQLIGYIGLVLPLILIVVSISRDGFEQWRNLESISHYYYSGAAAAFVGMLVSLALFLFTCRGYDNESNNADRMVARVAAIAALGVAFFPTRAPTGVSGLPWWHVTTGVYHYACAVSLFSMFAVFSLWLFRKQAKAGVMSPDKRIRNRIYLICGIAIVACIAWAGFEGMHNRPIFWPESGALIAFAISWLVKGYAPQAIAHWISAGFRRVINSN